MTAAKRFRGRTDERAELPARGAPP